MEDKKTSSGPLKSCAKEVVKQFLADLNGHEPDDLFQTVIQEVEEPLIEVVMDHVKGNQSKAARMLGINRGTLRKKLVQYGLE